jgi:deoxyribodipyrimidine photolyase-like uncharacterized protein
MDFNVFGMGYFHTQFTAKPYLFSSKYIVAQSGRTLRPDDILDSLYWEYVTNNRDLVKYVGKRPAQSKLSSKEVQSFVQQCPVFRKK